MWEDMAFWDVMVCGLGRKVLMFGTNFFSLLPENVGSMLPLKVCTFQSEYTVPHARSWYVHYIKGIFTFVFIDTQMIVKLINSKNGCMGYVSEFSFKNYEIVV
jgi:hypothetical protein